MTDQQKPDRKAVVLWECVVTKTDGDEVFCDAYPLGESDREFWQLNIEGQPGWSEGRVFYVADFGGKTND